MGPRTLISMRLVLLLISLAFAWAMGCQESNENSQSLSGKEVVDSLLVHSGKKVSHVREWKFPLGSDIIDHGDKGFVGVVVKDNTLYFVSSELCQLNSLDLVTGRVTVGPSQSRGEMPTDILWFANHICVPVDGGMIIYNPDLSMYRQDRYLEIGNQSLIVVIADVDSLVLYTMSSDDGGEPKLNPPMVPYTITYYKNLSFRIVTGMKMPFDSAYIPYRESTKKLKGRSFQIFRAQSTEWIQCGDVILEIPTVLSPLVDTYHIDLSSRWLVFAELGSEFRIVAAQY